jgi:hypothetical protein
MKASKAVEAMPPQASGIYIHDVYPAKYGGGRSSKR